tara:strand:- start:990 stop:1394 length:405 start_codon:yes stop_codon:yes gene_type:complete
MSLDYNKVWTVMNDLDEVVQRVKIINDMLDNLRSTVYDWTDADEVIDEVEAVRGFSKYITQDLEDKSIIAWNEVVFKLNPNNPDNKKSRHGKDLDRFDEVQPLDGSNWIDFWASGKDILEYKNKDGKVHDSEGC